MNVSTCNRAKDEQEHTTSHQACTSRMINVEAGLSKNICSAPSQFVPFFLAFIASSRASFTFCTRLNIGAFFSKSGRTMNRIWLPRR